MGIFDALKCWITWLAKSVYYYGVEGAELILDSFAAVANVLLAVLPTVALPAPDLDGGIVGFINYFVPVDVLLLVATAVMTAWVLYRNSQWGMRCAKAQE